MSSAMRKDEMRRWSSATRLMEEPIEVEGVLFDGEPAYEGCGRVSSAPHLRTPPSTTHTAETVSDQFRAAAADQEASNCSGDTKTASLKESAELSPAPVAGGGVVARGDADVPALSQADPLSSIPRIPRSMASLRSSEISARAFATMPDLRMNPFYSPFSGFLAHMIEQQKPHAFVRRSHASVGSMETRAFAHVGRDAEQWAERIEGKMMLGTEDSIASEASPAPSTHFSVRSKPDSPSGTLLLEKTGSIQRSSSASSAAKARWTRATWYAVQEAHRRRPVPGHGEGLSRTGSGSSIEDPGSPHAVKKKNGSWRQRVHHLLAVMLNARFFNGLMIVITVYALFVPDLYFITTSSTAGDDILFSFTVAVFFLFLLELLLKSVATEGYRLSTFFWLDLFAVLSFIPDAAWLFARRDILAEVNDLSIARASRSARVAVRVARIARVGRLLLRIRFDSRIKIRLRDTNGLRPAAPPLALYQEPLPERTDSPVALEATDFSHSAYDKSGSKHGFEHSENSNRNKLNKRVTPHENPQNLRKVNSQFGKDLEERSIKAIIFAVIAMLVLGLLLDFATTPPETTSLRTEVEFVVNALYVDGGGGAGGAGGAGREGGAGAGGGGGEGGEGGEGGVVLERTIRTFVHGQEDRGTPVLFLRVGETVLYGSEEAVGRVRTYPKEVINAYWQDLGEVGAAQDIHVHLKDRERATYDYGGNLGLVLVVLAVLLSAAAGLSMMLRQQVVQPVESMLGMVEQFAQDPLQPLQLDGEPADGDLGVVQMSLIKFGLLLQLAVGCAGAKTISASLKSAESGLPIQGKIVHGFFGFCDIRRFTDITEAMQADAIKVVNGIAHYVHRAVSECRGFPNKNIGDAFLLVWRPTRNIGAVETAELALRSFLRIIIEVDRSRVLRRWILSRKVQARNPGLTLKMGFGLHFGWAVEGAIGSSLKIDASYLSPHVNMASRLEAATKQYGVQLLISEDVFNLLGESVQDRCRLVDRVIVKGSKKPVSLYTYDIPRLQSLGGSLPDDVDVTSTHLSCEEFFALVEPRIQGSMREAHSSAIAAYLGGPEGADADWNKAASLLEECLLMDPADGPSRAVLEYMRARRGEQYKTPQELGWEGVRVLDEK